MKLLQRLLVAAAITLLYLLLFPGRSPQEPRVIASWAVDPLSAPVEDVASGSRLGVPVDAGFAYLDGEGRVLYRGRSAYGVALSSESFVNYSKNPDQLVVQMPDGSFARSLDVSGHAHFAEDLLLAFAQAGTELHIVSDYGLGESIEITLPSLVTAVDSDSGILAMGLVRGEVLALDTDSTNNTPRWITLETPSVAIDPVIHSVALAEGADYLAVLAADPDLTVTIYALVGERGIAVARHTLSRGSPRVAFAGPSIIGFGEQVETDYELELLDVAAGGTLRIPMTVPPTDLSFGDGFTAVLGQGPAADPARGFRFPMSFTLVTQRGNVPVIAEWAANRAQLDTVDRTTLLRVDERYLGFRVEVE